MKNSLKAAISVFILGTLYFVFSGVFATCTLTPDNYQCNEDESCSISTGCLCFGNAIAYNDLCNGATIAVDNSGVPATAFSGNLITFTYTVTSYTGDKYFVLRLPLNIDYSIKYLNSSITPDNNILLSLGMANDPIFTIHAGETKTFIITGNVVAPYRAILSMRATGSVYKDPLLQQLSVQALSSVMDPGPYVTIAKSVSGAMPGFSGDTIDYTVTLQNIGSLGVVDLAFLERFPVTYLYAPVISFDGIVQNYSSFIAPNLYVYSGAYLVLNPGQIINIVVSSSLKDNFSPASFINTAAFTTGGSLTPSAQNIAIATGIIPAYLDVFASTITTGSSAPEMSGDVFAFTINYGQQGNMTATGMTMLVTITGTNISGATYSLSDLPQSGTGSFTVTGTLNANYTSGTLVCANARLASAGETESTGNNTIVGCYRVAPIADVMVSKQISPSINLENLVSGSNISYIITVTNTGTKVATGITLTDTLPSQLTYVSNNFGTPTIAGNQLTWTLNNLNPGASTSIILTGSINNYPNAGMDIINTGVVTTVSRESLMSNNQFVLTTHLSGISDVYITKTSSAISGFKAGTPVTYTINYGNAGGKTASGVVITDTFPSTLLSTPTTSRNIGSLAPGQTGTITIVGTMINDLPAGQVIANSVHIATSTVQLSTTNDDAVVTGTVPAVDGTYIDLIANNITRPALDNPPYGTNQNTMIQAVSGDVIRFTITYGDNGNVMVNNASISLGSLGGIASIQNTTVSVGTLNTGATLIMTGIVGPKNFITFSPTATLNYNTNQFKTDTLVVNEPFACGDGLLTRTEECDTNGPIGNIAPGQECENQQGACVLVTKFIVNNACITFDYTNPVTGFGTGSACDGENVPITQASCSSISVNGSTVTCNANNANANTRIAINCGNGTILSGFGTSLTATCTGGGTTATCLVGGETTVVPACSQALNAAACAVNTLDGDMIILDEDGNGDMAVVCEASDGSELDNATVDCGTDGDYDDGVCEYTDIDNTPTQRTITCSAAGGVSCEKDLIADQGFLADCGNGIREGYEACDGDDMPSRYDNGNYVCSNHCTIESLDYTPPACFVVNNGNISVQEGEIMPFRWKLETEGRMATSCNETNAGKILSNSLMCTFRIYNGTHLQSDNDGDDYAKEITKPCDEDNRGSSNLFNYFKNNSAFGSENTAYGRYSIPMEGRLDNTYGEYKLVLQKVTYDYCDGTDTPEGQEVDRICEVNFAVTKPYLAQRSAFGAIPKSTNINLDNYFNIQGKLIVTDTQLDQIMTVGANEYDGGQEIKTKMSSFITKYDKLAVKMNVTKPAGVTTIKKVPNQNIFIFEGNGGNVTIDGEYSKVPFTLITKNINLVIAGDLKVNGMFLVKNGNIIFDNNNLCSTKNQEVQGIFVTDKSFASIPPMENNALGRSRCNFGGLYVKGVLIGDGVENLVKQRRSQLNSRFYLTSSNKNSQNAQRRNKIFNGAAVLIEYSPSLWNALPPGASEFTKALEVYKK